MSPTGRFLLAGCVLALVCPALIAQAHPLTLFASTATPAVLNANAGAPLELGMKFTADVDGFVAGVRFYKGSSNLGTHIGSLWTSDGQLLAQATFSNETASGWQQVNFSAPVAITANTVYIVSYHSAGYFSYDSGFFNSPTDNPPLHAVSGASGNGVYSYGDSSTFPVSAAGGANFWVDVVFTTTVTPPPPPVIGYTLFSSTATPAVLNANAGAPLELGMKFTADVNGFVSGVRFYKGSSNLGTHVGSLWTSTGELLAQATFTNETDSGWQQVNFSAPVAITPNTVYLVSYHSTGGFSYTVAYFNSPVDNPPLHAPATSNGVYSFGANSTFPTLPVGANFWVDVLFTTPTGGASLVSIAVTPANPSIAVGLIQQFQAIGTYSDGSTQDISASVSWSSATPAVAMINSAGLAIGTGGGSSLITATQANISGTTTLTVTGAPPPPPPVISYTLFSSTATPAVLNANAGAPLELGMKFTADVNGFVSGVRFYKGSSNLGTHVGSLWTSDGQLLAQVTFRNETASGWQQVNFSAPVAITANTVYVVSYHSASYFSYDSGFFNSPTDNPPLHAVSRASGNGVYSYGPSSTFPITSAAGANFWVDILFTK